MHIRDSWPYGGAYMLGELWKELGIDKVLRIPLDNNRAENALRLVALGRKNFLFVHSEDAGKELALLYSLVVSCTRVGVNPVEYLADVLDRIDKTADDHVAELLLDRWKPPSQPGTATIFDA